MNAETPTNNNIVTIKGLKDSHGNEMMQLSFTTIDNNIPLAVDDISGQLYIPDPLIKRSYCTIEMTAHQMGALIKAIVEYAIMGAPITGEKDIES